MARGVLTLQKATRAGISPSYTAAAADGHGFNNNGQDVFLHVKNQNASTIVVTIETPNQVDGLDITDRAVSIPTGEERMIGPFPSAVYNQDDSGGDTGIATAVFVDTDIQTSVTYAALQMGDLSY